MLEFLEVTDKLPYIAHVRSVLNKMARGRFSPGTSVFLPSYSTNAPYPPIIWGCTELSSSYKNNIKEDYSPLGCDV
jgi:hypothetical protein